MLLSIIRLFPSILSSSSLQRWYVCVPCSSPPQSMRAVELVGWSVPRAPLFNRATHQPADPHTTRENRPTHTLDISYSNIISHAVTRGAWSVCVIGGGRWSLRAAIPRHLASQHPTIRTTPSTMHSFPFPLFSLLVLVLLVSFRSFVSFSAAPPPVARRRRRRRRSIRDDDRRHRRRR